MGRWKCKVHLEEMRHLPSKHGGGVGGGVCCENLSHTANENEWKGWKPWSGESYFQAVLSLCLLLWLRGSSSSSMVRRFPTWAAQQPGACALNQHHTHLSATQRLATRFLHFNSNSKKEATGEMQPSANVWPFYLYCAAVNTWADRTD